MSSSTGSTISSGGAGASDALSAPLAPGFRFHPTDEELVSYYLRRKILGRPLKVDAIAEVDLYKCDPWDLPSRSRIRSRDGEWYFFSPLDKKYSNGSGKTNRATGRGYWKTTGKDRAVYRRGGGKAVGMKKTLVFHVGKAPKGERTNWVMHEYRIEGEYDEALREAGVSQDSYVVCRIFQKAGPGPQNGAQYGAPYVDEEWRDYDDFDAKVVLPIASASPPAPNADPAAATALAVVAVPNPADDDFKTLLEEQGADSFNGRVGSVLKVNDDKNGMDKVDSVTMDGEASVLDFHQQQVLDFPIENYPLIEGIGVDDYLELNDFMDPVDMYLSNDQALYPAAGDFEVSPDMFVQRSGLPTTGCENFPYTTEEEVQLMQADPTSEQNFSFDMDDILGFEPSQYLLDGGADDVFLYSNASNQTEAVYGICGKDDANSQYLVTTGSSSSDPFDDIESFLEGPQDEHEYSFPDSADSTSWLHNERLATTKGDIVALQMNQQPSDIGGGNWSPASKIEPPAISQANIEKFDVYARDSKTDSSSKTITKRLWSMLDSISAPPALAAEAPLLVKSLVIDSAAWMKANRLAFEGDGKAAGSKPSKDSASIFEPCFRMHHCATSWMARNGFSVCFSVLLLAASVKIGRCYSRLFFM